MSTLVAIDPGYSKAGQGCAVAIFDNRALTYVGFMRPETLSPPQGVGDKAEVLWECPQVDRRTRITTPQIVKLAAIGGELAGMFAGSLGCRATPIAPSTWKGSVPKPVAHGRMWTLLTDPERTLLGGDATRIAIEKAKRKGALDRWGKEGARYYPSAWLTHNLLDAVGLGMWRLRRV